MFWWCFEYFWLMDLFELRGKNSVKLSPTPQFWGSRCLPIWKGRGGSCRQANQNPQQAFQCGSAIGGRICFVIATSICADTSLAISPLTSSRSIETDINVLGSDIIVKFLASTWSDSLFFLQKHRSLLNYEEKQLSRLGSGSLLANMRFVLCEEVRLDCPFYPESNK